MKANNNLKISSKFNIVVGVLLGDASLQTYTNGRTWRLRFIQGDLHKAYLFHLYDIFAPWVKTPPKSIDDGFGNIRWYFNTTVQPELTILGKKLYLKRGKKRLKIIPSNIDSFLTVDGLAYWYQDDGYKINNGKAYGLSTNCFSLKELGYLKEGLKKIWGIEVSFHKKRKDQYHLYIPRKNSEEFKNLIKPYIHESMKYKI